MPVPSLLIAVVLFFAGPPAGDPLIENVSATAAGGAVSVRFSFANAFQNGETVQALQSGLPTSFTYIVEAFRDRPNWFNHTLGEARIEVIATFNSVTREYLLNYRRDRKLVRSETFTDFDALARRMTNIEEPGLFNLGHYRAHKVKVRVRADIERRWLLHMIPWDLSTRWSVARVGGGAP